MNISARHNLLGERVDLGDGVLVPERVTVTATPDMEGDPPHEVVAEVVAHDGRLVCEEVTLRRVDGGPPVTTESLRRVPLAGIVGAGLRGSVLESGEDGVRPFSIPSDVAAHGPTDQALRAAATVYRFSHALGEPPTKAVAASLGLTHSTAARWVAKARERGYLGPTSQGRAGEVTGALNVGISVHGDVGEDK
jgi:hypothetical protein